MATGTLGNVARTLSFQAMHYLQFTINYNDASVSSGTSVPILLPKGAMIAHTDVFVQTAFNAGTSNAITVGTNASSYNNLVASTDVVAGTASKGTKSLHGMDLGKLAADSQIFYTYAQTGTAATAGKAYVTVAYYLDNDLNQGT